jgi:hypothetical protein
MFATSCDCIKLIKLNIRRSASLGRTRQALSGRSYVLVRPDDTLRRLLELVGGRIHRSTSSLCFSRSMMRAHKILKYIMVLIKKRATSCTSSQQKYRLSIIIHPYTLVCEHGVHRVYVCEAGTYARLLFGCT